MKVLPGTGTIMSDLQITAACWGEEGVLLRKSDEGQEGRWCAVIAFVQASLWAQRSINAVVGGSAEAVCAS